MYIWQVSEVLMALSLCIWTCGGALAKEKKQNIDYNIALHCVMSFSVWFLFYLLR